MNADDLAKVSKVVSITGSMIIKKKMEYLAVYHFSLLRDVSLCW